MLLHCEGFREERGQIAVTAGVRYDQLTLHHFSKPERLANYFALIRGYLARWEAAHRDEEARAREAGRIPYVPDAGEPEDDEPAPSGFGGGEDPHDAKVAQARRDFFARSFDGGDCWNPFC